MTRRVRYLLPIILLCAFGAGCSHAPQAAKDIRSQFQQAPIVPGVDVMTLDARSARRLRSTLAPSFTDQNGAYLGDNFGERIAVHLGQLGTSDEAASADKAALVDRQTWSLGLWRLSGGIDAVTKRPVIHARVDDAEAHNAFHHEITCEAGATSGLAFWEGCRTFINQAHITVVAGDALKSR